MKHLAIRIANLKAMIALEEKRVTLQEQISTIDQRLATIQDQLYGAGALPAVAARSSKVVSKGKRKGRGELKGQILELLQAIGKAGSSVKELAARIGVKEANVHSWFSANLKKMSGLKKIGAARYALTEAAVIPSKPSKPAKKVKAPKAKKVKVAKKAIKAAKAPKKVKALKADKVVKVSKPRAVRGQLKEQILNELKNAGAEGITIKDLAAKINANYKNVYVWFVTTGKRIGGIKKVGPAQYKLEAAA
jgi:ribosome-binding protein aMBF1 (putative translation factor)